MYLAVRGSTRGITGMKLTAKRIAAITEPGKYSDDAAPGLFVLAKRHVSKTTGKASLRLSFVQRITIHGKRVDLGLGSPKWGAVTLTEARNKAMVNYKLARRGLDPRHGGSTVPTFEAATGTVIELHAANWRDGGKSAAQWRASLRDYAMPRLGRKPVDRITTADVMSVLNPIWNSKRETARRVRQRIGAVMKWAVANGYRNDNPAGDAIGAALPKAGPAKAHYKALPHAGVSKALATIRNSNAWLFTKLAIEFVVLTAARSGEVRGATWSEFDMEAGVWTVPADRTKASKEHRVPLSERALAILREAEENAAHEALVFPSPTGRKLSDNTLSKLLRENGIGCVVHGFRSTFRDWCGDTGQPREIAEMALAHVVKGVEGAYARSDLLERRRALMHAWSAYVEGGNVVPIHKAG